jgi:hypothetical protein
MRLTSADGTNFNLTIAGYQYPHLAAEPYDSNWLDISVEIDGAQGRWRSTDPALLTYEVAELADWLETIASGSSQPACTFFEPCLAFQLIERSANQAIVAIALDYGFRPPWIAHHEGGLTITFTLSDADLRAAAADLRAQLERYPQRAER